MKNLFRYISILLASGAIAVFLIYTTMAFSPEKSADVNTIWWKNQIEFFVPKISDTDISYEKTSGQSMDSEIFSVNFGRLASAFFLSHDTKTPKELITRDEKNIFIEPISVIFSWYDPFTNYILSDNARTFELSQITNGSVYISHEDDGSISIYSVDLVANLGFLADNQKMTEMMIFPGMKVRFDPRQNSRLKNADLLVISQILSDAKTASANTGIEFLYPRIEIGENSPSIFGLAQLSQKNRQLFKYLEKSLQNRVKTIDTMKQYASLGHGSFVNSANNSEIINPTKNMYRILGELQIIFSRAVNGELTSEEFQQKVVEIRSRAAEFELQDRADELLQQFLIDGRFALYANSGENSSYKKLYEEAALILGIVPEDGKWKFFQSLSDIFSQSIIFSDKKNLTISIETASALKKTLDQREMNNKDYFDIALYSFSLFEKISWDPATNKNVLTRSWLESSAIYELYSTILQATQNYLTTFSDKNLQNNASLSIATNFYDPMVKILSNSLYSVYTTPADGVITLASAFVNRGEAELSAHNHNEIVKNLNAVHSKLFDEIFTKKLLPIYGSGNSSAKLQIEMQSARIKGFVDMVTSGNYRNYLASPFLLESASVALPRYDFIGKILVRKNEWPVSNISGIANSESAPNKQENAQNKQNNSQKVAKNLSDSLGFAISESQVTEKNNLFEISANSQNKKISFTFSEKDSKITSLRVEQNREIYFRDSLTLVQAKNMIANIFIYESKATELAKKLPILSSGLVEIDLAKRQIIIKWQAFPL